MEIYLQGAITQNKAVKKAIENYASLIEQHPRDKSLAIYSSTDNLTRNSLVTIIKTFLKMSEITILSLSNLKIDRETLMVIKEDLSNKKSLTNLDVSHNHLGDEGLEILLEIMQLRPLKVLNISENKITDIGAQKLFNYLQNFHSLEVLEAQDNQITDIDLLLHNSLTDINLSYNRIEKLDKIPELSKGAVVTLCYNPLKFLALKVLEYFPQNHVMLNLKNTSCRYDNGLFVDEMKFPRDDKTTISDLLPAGDYDIHYVLSDI